MDRSKTGDENGHVIDVTSSKERQVNSTNGRNGRRRRPPSSVDWILYESIIRFCHIIGAIVFVWSSDLEHPLYTWVIGYASGCVASLPRLFWRFYNYRNPGHCRPKLLVKFFNMGLDCFFFFGIVAVDMWVYSDGPDLDRLCLTYLTSSCIGYVVPKILCAISVCMICVVESLEDMFQNRGVTYKDKIKKHNHVSNSSPQKSSIKGGVVAAETDNNKCVPSREDSVNYGDDDGLMMPLLDSYFSKK